MEEVWKNINGYEGLYKISNFGKVINNKGKVKSTYINNKGYCCISLYKDGKGKHYTLHRLVAEAFIQNDYGLNQVNHIDGNKLNNTVSNLEWCNQAQNYTHGMANFYYSHNEDHYFAKLTNEQVKCIPTLLKIGFTTSTVSKILCINNSSLRAIINGISYRELGLKFNFTITKYKDLPNIKLPSDIWKIFKDNTELNTLIAQGKVSV